MPRFGPAPISGRCTGPVLGRVLTAGFQSLVDGIAHFLLQFAGIAVEQTALRLLWSGSSELFLLTHAVAGVGKFDDFADEVGVGAAGMLGGDGKLCSA